MAKWQGRVVPLLRQQRKQGKYDIHSYSQKILEALEPIKKGEDDVGSTKNSSVYAVASAMDALQGKVQTTRDETKQGKDVPFAALLDLSSRPTAMQPSMSSSMNVRNGVGRFEVCRIFLATLSLANKGNVLILNDNDSPKEDDTEKTPNNKLPEMRVRLLSQQSTSTMSKFQAPSLRQENQVGHKRKKTNVDAKRSTRLRRKLKPIQL